MNVVRGGTIRSRSQADSCGDPYYDADWHPLKDAEGEFLILLLILNSTVSGQTKNLTRYQPRPPPPCIYPFLSNGAILAKRSSQLCSSGATYIDMSRKNAASGRASPMSCPGVMYGAGEPCSQTQRKETMANEGMIVIIRIIIESPSLLEK